MSRFDSLRSRIVVAYLLFALCASLFFAVIAAVAVEGIEVRLVDERLMEIASWASPRHAGRLPVEMPDGVSFLHGDSIPYSLRGLAPGVHEKEIDGVSLSIFAGRDAEGDFVVLDHESDYEKIELIVYGMFALAFLGFLILSLFLGRFVASRVVTPITALAGAVKGADRPQELPLLERKDELGILARSFAAHTAELNSYLARERFFTGDVSHELRTPLTVIIGAAEILMAQTEDQPALRAPAERILRAATEAAESVSVLLMLARAPERIDSPETQVHALVEEEVTRCRSLLAHKPVRLEFVAPADTAFVVQARPELLRAAIGNLIRNACQYTEQGSIIVRIRNRAVSVEDTGPGLPDAVRAKLADAAGPHPDNGSAGTGLGLALVKRICETLGAELRAEDRQGGGSMVILDFSARLTKS